jgi:hypothetical protein
MAGSDEIRCNLARSVRQMACWLTAPPSRMGIAAHTGERERSSETLSGTLLMALIFNGQSITGFENIH